MGIAILRKKIRKGGPLLALEVNSSMMLSGFLSPELHAFLRFADSRMRRKRKNHYE